MNTQTTQAAPAAPTSAKSMLTRRNRIGEAFEAAREALRHVQNTADELSGVSGRGREQDEVQRFADWLKALVPDLEAEYQRLDEALCDLTD